MPESPVCEPGNCRLAGFLASGTRRVVGPDSRQYAHLVLADRVAALDTELFAHIVSAATDDDRKSLLAIHNGVATRCGRFSYLEIGSHLGGSLQAVIADPRCTKIVSIDSRTRWVPDDRPGGLPSEYVDNTTEQMRSLLAGVPNADMSKLETVDKSTGDLSPGRFARPDLCFIDGEHTYVAALRDARFCRRTMQGEGIMAFHDFIIVERAIRDFLRETPRPRRGYLLLNGVFVVELGAMRSLLSDARTRSRLTPRGRIMDRLRRVDTWLLAADIRRRSALKAPDPQRHERPFVL